MNKYIYFQKHLSKAAEEFTKFEKNKQKNYISPPSTCPVIPSCEMKIIFCK